MSEKELDEILKEIKNHSNAENNDNHDLSQQAKSADEVEFYSTTLIDDEPADEEDITLTVQEKNEEVSEIDEVKDNSEPVAENDSQEGILLEEYSNYYTDYEEKNSNKKVIIAIAAIILIIAIGVGVYFGFFHKKDEVVQPSTTEPAITQAADDIQSSIVNPLTGETGYSQSAMGKRPVAVVVENEYSTESVRPQWGLSDADIVLEGESEYSTRMLLIWADYNNMPEKIGPCRSARPPFIRFSQLFDSVFIHCGLSKSKGNYVGANTVFKTENVDHINGLSESMDGTYFGRNYERTSTVEHTAYLNGKNVADLLKKNKINTDLNTAKFSTLSFNSEVKPLGDTSATSVNFIFSDVHSTGRCPKTAKFVYDESSAKYTTADFDSKFGTSDAEFENLIFLLDETEYVVKENYKNSGKSETYCDYKLSGGNGTIVSNGTAIDITWGVDNGKLWLKSADGTDISLNPGKSYIGYGSSNHGGKVTLNPTETE